MVSHQITRRLFGFSVARDDGPRVVVDLEPWTFVVEDPNRTVTRIGIPDAAGLARAISEAFSRPPPKRRTRERRPFRLGPSLLASDVAEEWMRLLERVPGEIAAVHAAVLTATESSEGPHASPRFYDRRFLVRDVLNLRAAAIAVGHAHELLRGRNEDDLDGVLDDLEDWPRLFSPSGRAYTSLRRTLGRIPDEIPSTVVCALRDVELARPVTDPVELSAICLATPPRSRAGSATLRRILLHANAKEIRTAASRIGETLGQRLDARVLADLTQVLLYLADCPSPHEGRLGGLVTKAIRWHESWERRSLGEALSHAGYRHYADKLDTPTRRPPFPLPENPAVRFLETVGDIAREGREMDHCVAMRVGAAVGGDVFLFHVDHEDQRATIEVACEGWISEAAGPSNRRSAAATWGAKLLSTWWSEGERNRSRRFDATSPADLPRRGKEAAVDWEDAVAALRASGEEPAWLKRLERFRNIILAEQQ